ncbi:hypothetical protein ATCC90586_006833 [Pythium insidiosum]|nr:hypothetical protein ATCC90586_006833 [Pythium insidiosum]
MSRPLLVLLAVSALAALADASIYPVHSRLWIPPFQHAEKMFASDRGPILARSGLSTVSLNITGVNVTKDMNAWRLVLLAYHVDSLAQFQSASDQMELLACASSDVALRVDGMNDVQKRVFPVRNASVHAEAQFRISKSGWIDTQVFVCSDTNGAAEVLPFVGTLTVRNPFGLLPAVLYGMLPFSALLTIGYVMLNAFFIALVIRHRRELLQLHYGILLVLVMGVAASAAWFYAFFRMNKTGEPVCCPYPTTFLVAVILDTLMRTLARIILIVVCLGYGIVREKLRRGEVALISVVALCYFVSGVGDEVTRGTSSGAEFREKPTAWSFVQLLCNLFFIMWIHRSLERIVRQLDEQKQSAKLAMYRSLAYALAAFIVFFSVLTVVAVCGRAGVFEWDVEWEWMQLVAWPVLNFTVSAAMCFIWRPTTTSSQYAFSMQLPMSDDPEKGLEMAPSAFSRDSEDDEDGIFGAGGDITFSSDDDLDEDEIEVELSPPKDALDKGKARKSARADADADADADEGV